MKRQQANLRILEALEAMVNKHPDQRFCQLLFNLDVFQTYKDVGGGTESPRVTNEYATESTETLSRIRSSGPWNAE